MKVLKNVCGVVMIYLCIGLVMGMMMMRTSNLLDNEKTTDDSKIVMNNK